MWVKGQTLHTGLVDSFFTDAATFRFYLETLTLYTAILLSWNHISLLAWSF